jgi:O-6-methylguanine DNA methyltransferase
MNDEKPAPPLECARDRLCASPDRAAGGRARETLCGAGAGVGTAPLYSDRIPDTPIGPVYFAANDKGLIDVDFAIPEKQFISRIEKQFGIPPTHAPEKLAEISAQLSDYLTNKRTQLSLPFDISSLTPFQQQVLHAALQIPRGQVTTYTDIARKIGNPKAVRAVGQALGRNPVPIVIPCHRVIAANGKLGGYSGGGGLATKRKLLVLEGAMMA